MEAYLLINFVISQFHFLILKGKFYFIVEHFYFTRTRVVVHSYAVMQGDAPV